VCRCYFIRLCGLRERKKMLVNIASYRPEFEPTPSEYRIILVSTISPCSVVLPKKTVLAKNLNDATPLFVGRIRSENVRRIDNSGASVLNRRFWLQAHLSHLSPPRFHQELYINRTTARKQENLLQLNWTSEAASKTIDVSAMLVNVLPFLSVRSPM